MSDELLKNVLIRGRSIDLNCEYGAAIVNDITRRPITFDINYGERTETKPGIALIGDAAAGSNHNLEPFARNICKIVITIERLPEFLFIPTRAHRDPLVGLWTIEAIPFVDWFRLRVKTDEQLLREAGMT